MAGNSNANTTPVRKPAVVQLNKGNTLLVGGWHVVIYANDTVSNIWATSYVAEQQQARKLLPMPNQPKPKDALKVIQQAAQMAGVDGHVIFLVGHGLVVPTMGTFDPKKGAVDLAPGQTVRLAGPNMRQNARKDWFVNVFYDVNLTGPPGFSDQKNDQRFNKGTAGAKLRGENWAIYQEMGRAFRNAQVYKVTFLTCRVGNAKDFIKKIANDWGVIVQAPKPRVEIQRQQNGNVRVYLQGDMPGKGTNIPESEHEVPVLTDANSYAAGPPLPPVQSP